MLRTWTAFAIAVGVLTAAGCRGTGQPQFFGPGSAPYQQQRAQRFDPYPETNIGPSVEGGRPESYSAPAPEPARGHPNQWSASPFGR
jgi:hypothetical protein